MLKIERKKKELTVSLRTQEGLWNRTFLIAFTIALGIHVSAFFLFHIQPFTAYFSTIFPPVNVQSPRIENQISLLEKNQKEEFPLLDLHEPYAISLNETYSIEKSYDLTMPQFTSIEEPLNIPVETTYTPLKMEISGPLKQYKLTNPIEDHVQSRFGSGQYYHISYQVQVEPETGAIFWYDKKESSGKPAIDQQMEKVLLSLKFTPADYAAGQIDFYYYD